MSLKRKLARLPRLLPQASVESISTDGADQQKRDEKDNVDPAQTVSVMQPSAPDAVIDASLPAANLVRDDDHRSKIHKHLQAFKDVYAARQRRRISDSPSLGSSQGPLLSDEPCPTWQTTVTYKNAVRVLTHRLPVDYQQGSVAVRRAMAIDKHCLSYVALNTEWLDVDLQKLIFVDTETTGLGGGTGIIPFLIGLAWFEHNQLVVQQLLLEELGEEEEMIETVHERFNQATGLVSYNGKTYDWPLLSTRAVMNRRPPLPQRPHLDLLHCARRIYRRRLGQVRLIDIEERILGMQRTNDIPGEEIPGVYWRYLEDRVETDLCRVLTHNVHDLISLAAMLAILTERYASVYPEDDPQDHLGRAKVGFRAQDWGRAERFAQVVLEGEGTPEVVAEAALLWARECRRKSNYEQSARILHKGLSKLASAPMVASALHLELAKLYEHQLKLPQTACHHAKYTEVAEGLEAQQKRINRLMKRCQRLGRPPKDGCSARSTGC